MLRSLLSLNMSPYLLRHFLYSRLSISLRIDISPGVNIFMLSSMCPGSREYPGFQSAFNYSDLYADLDVRVEAMKLLQAKSGDWLRNQYIITDSDCCKWLTLEDFCLVFLY